MLKAIRVWREKRAKWQYSKIMCDRSWWLMAGTLLLDFALRWSGRGTLGDVTIAIISFVTVFVNGGYICQNIFRDKSLNDNGLHLPEAGDKHYIEPAGAAQSTI